MDVLPTLPPRSFDLTIGDPPYMIGLAADASKGRKRTAIDDANAARLYALWIGALDRVLKPSGFGVLFTNWQGFAVLHRAAVLAGVRIANLVVWDKDAPGMSARYQLRQSYELALVWAGPEARVSDRSIRDVVRSKWCGAPSRSTDHPAEKPVDLMRQLIAAYLPGGGRIVDPFAGSGTVAVAARAAGCPCTSIEADPRWLPLIRSRLAQAELPLGSAVA